MEKVSVAAEEIMQSTSSLSSVASQQHGAFPEEEMTCLWVIPLMGPTLAHRGQPIVNNWILNHLWFIFFTQTFGFVIQHVSWNGGSPLPEVLIITESNAFIYLPVSIAALHHLPLLFLFSVIDIWSGFRLEVKLFVCATCGNTLHFLMFLISSFCSSSLQPLFYWCFQGCCFAPN